MSTTSAGAGASVPADMPVVAGVRHRFVHARGVRFHVAEAGDAGAPAVVLLHGWPSNWYCWREHFTPLAQAGLRPVAIDLRGFGWSETTPRGYRKASLAGDVLAVLDTMGVDRFRLAGHDWGGFVAFLLGLGHPERVERLVLINTGHGYAPRDLHTLKDLRGFFYMPLIGAPLLGPALIRSGLVRRAVTDVCLKDGSWPNAATGAIYFDRIAPHVTQQVYGSFIYGGELLAGVTGRFKGTRMRVPTLFLYGDRDPAIRPATIRGMEEHADDYRLEVLPGLGHFCIEQAPELVAAKIAAFTA